MLIDVGHVRWIVGTTVAAAAALSLYVWIAPAEGLRGTTTAVLWYGIAGTALMVYCGLLAVLRKVPAWWWLGARKTWLKAHIWLGLLSVVLILCHSGFRLGGGLGLALWVVLALIVFSGILGVLLQQSLPGLLMRQVPNEVSYEQLPHYCRVLRGRADDLCDAMKMVIPDGAGADESAVRFYAAYDEQVRPFFESPAPRRTIFPDEPAIHVWHERIRETVRILPIADAEVADTLIEGLRPRIDPAQAKELLPRLDKLRANVAQLFDTADTTGLPSAAKAAFVELRTLATTANAAEVAPAVESQAAAGWLIGLESLCLERSRLRLQERVHRWLHSWLLLHVPFSVVLLVLTIIHVVMSLYY